MDYLKKVPLLIIYLLLSPLFVVVSCSQAKQEEGIPLQNSTRVIEFSGYEWVVRTSDNEKQGPGPNYFSDSDENVWVDTAGRLHLKIVERGGIWYCSGVTLRKSHGFNKYVFYVSGRVDRLDENVVGGLFTYMNNDEEIDIEFSRWSDPENQDSQFAVQPSYLPGNKVRYDLNLTTDLSTHFFDWQPDKIEFASYNGHTLNPETEDVISTWTYSGNNIPPDSDERLKVNLWLFRGKAPVNKNENEMIIDRVEIY